MTTDNARILCIAAIIGMIVAPLGPWIDGGLVSVSGVDAGDGIFVLCAGMVAALMLALSNSSSTWSIGLMFGAGVLGAIVCVYDIVTIEDADGLGSLASPGWGLIVALVASIALTLGAHYYGRALDADARAETP